MFQFVCRLFKSSADVLQTPVWTDAALNPSANKELAEKSHLQTNTYGLGGKAHLSLDQQKEHRRKASGGRERDVDVTKALYGTKRKVRIGILGAFSLLRIQE